MAATALRISGETNSGNLVAGNWIGTNVSGSTGLGNVGHGVFVLAGAHDNRIGGASNLANIIAFNQQNGVVVGGSASDVGAIHNAIFSNSIFSDGNLGIDLGNNGVTMNTNPSPHSGPNRFQNFPVIVEASSTTVTVTLDSTPNQSFMIQLFASPVSGPLGYGEGQTLISTLTLPTNGSGSGDVTLTLPQNLKGQWISATATDSAGDTSEFAQSMKFMGAAAVLPLGVPASPAPFIAVERLGGGAISECGSASATNFTLLPAPIQWPNPPSAWRQTRRRVAVEPPFQLGSRLTMREMDDFFVLWRSTP